MAKTRKSVTIDEKVNSRIKKKADDEGRSFSNMIEQMAKKYLGLKI